MINLFIDYIIAMWQDPLIDFETLLISATLGAIPFICATAFALYNISRVYEKIILALVSIFTLMYALTYTHRLIVLIMNGYKHDDILKFFVYLSGSITAIIITTVYAKKALKKTAYATKNGITKECKTIEKENKND